MQVICVNCGYHPSEEVTPSRVPEGWELKEGEIYNVINSFVDEGYCWYVIDEDPLKYWDGGEWGYCSERFSSLTETNSAIEEANKIIVKQPKKWYQKIFNF